MDRLPGFGEFRRCSWVPVLAKPLGLSSLFARQGPHRVLSPTKDVCPRDDSMENAFEPLRWGVGLIHTRFGAMLNVQCSGETGAPVDQVSEVWKLEGDADRSVRWVVLRQVS